MKVPTFKTVNFPDQVISRFQDNVGTVLSALAESEILNYVLVKNVALLTTDTTVAHGLGRAAQGYLVVKASAATSVYTSPNDSGTSTSLLLLRGTGPATVTLLIF